jgi:phage baseplate assembly protein W
MTEVRRTFRFKSTGSLVEDSAASRIPTPEVVDESRQGISIRTPLRLASEQEGSTFEMHFGVRESIRDNLRNLLATNHGERLGEYDFGANLREFVAELERGSDPSALELRIRQTIAKWMPFVQVESVTSKSLRPGGGMAEFDLRVVYRSPELFSETDAVVVNFKYM